MCLEVTPGEPQVRIVNSDKSFTYNYVFPPDAEQEEFYDVSVKQLLDNIFQGYNVTILAYGQTGSGKTHSMGTNYTGVEKKIGIIPRVIEGIFHRIKSEEDCSFKVAVSFLELYEEQLHDLLSNKRRSQSIINITGDKENIKFVGTIEKEVRNVQETLECLSQGSISHVTETTAMNAHSSLSHAIFTICIRQQKIEEKCSMLQQKLRDMMEKLNSKERSRDLERYI